MAAEKAANYASDLSEQNPAKSGINNLRIKMKTKQGQD
jgi:hypothetical protein